MFGKANFMSNGQSLSGDEGKAGSEKPLKACRKHHVRKATFLLLIAGKRAAPELRVDSMFKAGGTGAAGGYWSAECPAPVTSRMPYFAKLLLLIFCLVLLVESRKHRRRRWTSQLDVQRAR